MSPRFFSLFALCFCPLLFIFPFFVFSQSASENVTFDRPGIADSPFSVKQGSFQPEVGADYLRHAQIRRLQAPNILLRCGLTERTELRIYAKSIYHLKKLNFPGTKFAPMGVGAKITIAEQKGILPFFAVMSHVYVPFYDKENPSSHSPGGDALLLFQHNINEKFSFNYNMGYTAEAISEQHYGMSSWCLNYILSGKLSCFGEYYNVIPFSRKTEHAFDAGFMYLVTPLIQLDVSAGIAENKKHFISAGIATRVGGNTPK